MSETHNLKEGNTISKSYEPSFLGTTELEHLKARSERSLSNYGRTKRSFVIYLRNLHIFYICKLHNLHKYLTFLYGSS